MTNQIIWALLTGGITGWAWAAIVLFQRQKRLEAEATTTTDRLEQFVTRMEQLQTDQARLEELEARLDFTERLLTRKAEGQELAPPER